MPKLSRYNHLQPWTGGYHIAYNAGSGAVALMTDENVVVYNSLADKLRPGQQPSLTDPEQELLKQLQYGRFVVEDSLDEREAFRFRHNMDRFDQTVLGLVLAPTMACNMACQYCYEANKKGRMSPKAVEELVTFVENRAPYLRALNTTWYGGEPLLAMDIIEDLSATFMDMAEEHKFAYASSMISNGYLLTPPTVDRLAALKVASVQLTVDGPARIHNVKRPMKNGRPSFDTILANIAYAVDKMAVNIRVNIDKGFTTEMVMEMLQELKAAGLQEKIGLYYGLIEPSTQACANISESCYETADFSQVEIEYNRLLLEHGFRIDKLPAPMSAFCMAQIISSFLIDPEGRLFRCFNHVGDEKQTIGTIREEIDYQHPNFTRLFRVDPFNEPRCYDCNLLPVCMGGCPSRRTDRGMSGDQMCESWKHNLRPMLEIIARSRQQQLQRQQQAAAAAGAKE